MNQAGACQADGMHSHIAISRLSHGKFRVFDIMHSSTQWGSTEHEDIDLKMLARAFDTMPTFVSLYLDMEDERKMGYFSKRAKECENVLRNERGLHANFVAAVERMKGFVEKLDSSDKRTKGLAVFSSPARGFFEAYELPFKFDNSLIVDTSPYIRNLAMNLESWENYCILHLDKSHARIYVASSLKVFDADNIEKDILHHHRKGGMSQMRYQRLYEGKVLHFYKEVAEDLQRVISSEGLDKIIIAGPHDAKSQIIEHLPIHIQKKIVGTADLPITLGALDIVDDTLPLLQKAEVEADRALVQKLHEEVLREGLGVYGTDAIFAALNTGNVDTLIVEKGKVLKGEKCETCGSVAQLSGSAPGKCGECGAQKYVVDVFEEMIEAAEEIDAKMRFVAPSEEIEALGGAGAFLRFVPKTK